ncbi:MAG: DMT family transporter [Desulfovibrionaceae bacterium]
MHATALRANILLCITAAIWGAAFVAQRVGMEHVGPYTFNGVRFLLGAAALAPLIWRMHKAGAGHPAPTRPGLKSYLLGGVAAGAILFAGATLQQVGLMYTTAGKAGFITGLYVVIVPFMGLCFRMRSTLGAWVGAGLAAVGLYFLSITEDFTIAYGDLLELVGAVFWAGHVLILGWLSQRLDPVKLACAQFVTCGICSLAMAVATEPITASGLAGATPAILYGGLMSVGVAYTLQVVAQRDAHPTHAAIILSLEAVFAAITGYFMLDEVLSPRGMLGCGLMMGGMLLSQLWPGNPSKA